MTDHASNFEAVCRVMAEAQSQLRSWGIAPDDRAMDKLWAIARVDLRLTEEEFWRLTFYELALLINRYRGIDGLLQPTSAPKISSALGQRIRQIRESRTITQATLAAKVGISREALNMIETGRTKHPQLGTLKAIADALGVEVAKLHFTDTSH